MQADDSFEPDCFAQAQTQARRKDVSTLFTFTELVGLCAGGQRVRIEPGNPYRPKPLRNLANPVTYQVRLFCLLLMVCATFAASAGPAQPSAALSRAILQLSAGLSDGSSKLDPASIRSYALPGKAAVLFTLEGPGGGNGSLQFIAFFVPDEGGGLRHRRQTRYRLLAYRKIGSRGSRLFLFGSGVIHNGQLALKGATYRASDPMCCPSRQLSSSFAAKGGHVVEQPLTPDNSPMPKPLH